MTLVTYIPASGYDANEKGVINAGGGTSFDVGAALTAGGGQFTIDDQITPTLASVLDKFPGLQRSGSAPGPVNTLDIIGPVLAHSKNAAPGDLLVRGADGIFAPSQSAPSAQIPSSVIRESAWIDLFLGSSAAGVAACSPATKLAVTFTSGQTSATITAGTAPPAGGALSALAIISDSLPQGTTYTVSGNTLTLSNPANASGSAPAWAGQDCTSAIQAALTYFNTQNINGTIYASIDGIYLVNGAQQTGTAQGYSYSGQVLIPARNMDTSTGMISVRFRGPQPIAGFPGGSSIMNPSGGLILLSGASTGSMFDVIPGTTPFSNKMSGIVVHFEDIGIRLPTNPQTNAINMLKAAGLTFRGACQIDTIGVQPAASQTGTGFAIVWPTNGNMAQMHQAGDLTVQGYPNGTNTGEHLVVDNIFILYCKNAITPANTAHMVYFNKAILQGVVNGINVVTNPTKLSGRFDIGDIGVTNFINDSGNSLYGKIEVLPVSYSNSGLQSETPGLGIPCNGGLNAIVSHQLRERVALPSDTFGRAGGSLPLTLPNGPGMTDRTGHIWSPVANGTLFPAGGGMMGLGSGYSLPLLRYNAGRANPSRIVRVGVTPGTGYNLWIQLGKCIGTNFSTTILFGASGVISINRANVNSFTTLASSATGQFVANTAYTVDCYISNPYSAAGAFTVSVYIMAGVGNPILSGTLAVTKTMAAGDTGGNSITLLQDTEEYLTQDGLAFFSDTTSLITKFAVLPAS